MLHMKRVDTHQTGTPCSYLHLQLSHKHLTEHQNLLSEVINVHSILVISNTIKNREIQKVTEKFGIYYQNIRVQSEHFWGKKSSA